MVRPTTVAPIAQRTADTVPAPKEAVPKLLWPISSAAPRPTTTPSTPASSVSASAIRTSVRVEAPRVRSSAASRRRRSGARRGDQGGHQAGQDRSRDAEEQEQDLRVQGVLARGVERGAEVVADDPGSREAALEVVRPRGDGVECGAGAVGKCVRQRAWIWVRISSGRWAITGASTRANSAAGG